MNTDTIELKTIVYKHGNNWIAQAVDYTFIAQGLDPDSALSCLVGCLGAQYVYDKQKGFDPLSRHKSSTLSLINLFKNARNKYRAEIPKDDFSKDAPNIIPQLAYT